MVKFSRFVVISLVITVFLALAPAKSPASDSPASPVISIGHPSTASALPAIIKPSSDFVQAGLSGKIETDIVVTELAKGEKGSTPRHLERALYRLSGYFAELYSNAELCCGRSPA